MKIVVQQWNRKLFLRRDARWTSARSEAAEFKTVVEAIVFCIHCSAREVKLLGKSEAGADICLYPFGGDPAVKAELKRLRRNVRDSQRLKLERRTIQARMDALMAEGKEKKKQFPFKRKDITHQE